MAILLIREPGQTDRRVQLKGKETVIGRDEESDILLPHTTVSRQHAKIIRKTKDLAYIENLSEKNTVLLNGKKINKDKIKTKDTLQIGKFTLVYFGDNLSPMDQFFEGKSLEEFPIYARTANATKGDGTFSLSAVEAQKLLRVGNITRNARIYTSDKKQHWVPGKNAIGFGGSEEIQVDGWFTGGKVAEIRWDGATHILEKQSMLGTVLLNGNKVNKATPLQDGDQIQVGKSSFTYAMK